MAFYVMIGPHLTQSRLLNRALVNSVGTAWVEIATRRRIGWIGDFAFQNGAFPPLFRIRSRDGAHKGLGVRVQRRVEEGLSLG